VDYAQPAAVPVTKCTDWIESKTPISGAAPARCHVAPAVRPEGAPIRPHEAPYVATGSEDIDLK
jgi:hypothetical protein